MIITCLPRVDTVGLATESISTLTARIHSSMEAVYKASSVEVHQQPLRSGSAMVQTPVAGELAFKACSYVHNEDIPETVNEQCNVNNVND